MKTIFTIPKCFLMVVMLLASLAVQAQKLPFQGKLLENGAAVTGTRDFQFSIAGTTWTETHSAVQVSDGLYFVLLGSINALPVNLFETSDTRQLNVSVGGQSLSPVQIFAAMVAPNYTLTVDAAPDGKSATKSTISGMGTSSKFYTAIEGKADVQNGQNVSIFGVSESPSGNNELTIGVVGRARGEGTGIKIGAQGLGTSLPGSTNSIFGIYGTAEGSGNGDHFGLRAESNNAPSGRTNNYGGISVANGVGKYNTGIRGLATGAGDGSTGFLVGSYNNGVQGFARGNTWGNTGVYGYVYNNSPSDGPGVDNNGVVGLSAVGISGNTTVQNAGVRGRAEGPGINKGIVGQANGGVENWAGWFDGDVRITGQLVYDGDLNVAFPEVITKNINEEGIIGALTLNAEGNGGGASAGLITSSSALVGSNSGVRSTVTSVSSNTANHYGYLANVTHGGTGQAAGLWANMFGDGTGNKIGVRTAVSGNNSAINYGVRAINSAVTTDGGSNWGGLFTVTGTGVANSTNIGLDANVTKDNGKNIGIRGSASGGTENWAGWFDGDVKITGDLILDGGIEIPTMFEKTFDLTEPGSIAATLVGTINGTGAGLNTFHSGIAGVNNATNTYGAGVRGITYRTTTTSTGWDIGVFGFVYPNPTGSTNGFTYGVRGEAVSGDHGPSAVGVRGLSFNTNNAPAANPSVFRNSGGYFSAQNNPLYNMGMVGIAFGEADENTTSSNYGVWGQATGFNSAKNIAIFGRAANAANENWAGYFEGDVKITGNLIMDGDLDITIPDIFEKDEDLIESQVTSALTGKISGSGNNISTRHNGVYGETRATNSYTSAVYGAAYRNAGEGDAWQIGVLGDVFPNAAGSIGGYSYGMRAEVKEGDHGTLATGVRGISFNTNANPGMGIFRNSGGLFTAGSNPNINIGVVGDGRSGGGSSTNYGVWGQATFGGGLKNIGVYGTASNASENWAGWFQGDVKVIGNISSDGNGNYVSIDGSQGMVDMSKVNLTSVYGSAGQGALTLFDGSENVVDRIVLAVQDDDGRYWGNLFMNNSTSDAHVNISGDGFVNLYDGAGNQTIFLNGGNGQIDAIAVNQTSDARLKTNILPLNNALSNVMKMRGVSYNWIDKSKSEKLQIGVIAQEVEEVYPEFVHTNDEGMKSVNYSQMVAVLIEAIKELNTKVETLTAENTQLKASLGEVADLKQQMKSLQTLVAKLVSNESVSTSTTTEQR